TLALHMPIPPISLRPRTHVPQTSCFIVVAKWILRRTPRPRMPLLAWLQPAWGAILTPAPLILIPSPRIQIAAPRPVRLSVQPRRRRQSQLLLLVMSSRSTSIRIIISDLRIPRIVLYAPTPPCGPASTVRNALLLLAAR